MTATTIDVRSLFEETAKIDEMAKYLKRVQDQVVEGQDVILTGSGPIWLYLKIAHFLHGKARKLIYRSPVTGDMVIFDHNPF